MTRLPGYHLGSRRTRGRIGRAMVDGNALRAEALRVHQRYTTEVVEALGFCPWAAGARAAGRVKTRVVLGSELDLECTLAELDALSHDESVDIGLLVFPQVIAGRLDFQHWSARVREQVEQRAGRGRAAFAIADFHPDAEADLGSAERLVAFIRRSPDPTLQLVRRTVLDAVRSGEAAGTRFVDPAAIGETDLTRRREPIQERIARVNFQTVKQLGIARVTAVIEDILVDRDRCYAQLGLPPPPWRRRAGV
jgi:hypothetical protein